MTPGSWWCPRDESWVFPSLHFGGTHWGLTGLWVCACIHSDHHLSHPNSHMQHTSTRSWTHTMTTHRPHSLSVHASTHTHRRPYSIWHLPSLITGTHTIHDSPSASRFLQTLHWALHLILVWLRPSWLRTLQIRPSNLTHTLHMERFDWIDARELTAARLLTYSISHSCSAMIPRGICL